MFGNYILKMLLLMISITMVFKKKKLIKQKFASNIVFEEKHGSLLQNVDKSCWEI